jgi:hypothetical protein
MGDEGYSIRTDSPGFASILAGGVRVGSCVRLDSGNWCGTWFRPNAASARAVAAGMRGAAAAARKEL